MNSFSKPIPLLSFILLIFGGLAACATTSSFNVLRKGDYSYGAHVTAHTWGRHVGAQDVSMKRADEYCAAMGRSARFEDFSSRGDPTNPTIIYGYLEFQCVEQ